MDTHIHPAAHDEAEREALLLTIETIALARARAVVPTHAADDVAHDVVLECLIKMREGTWDASPDDLIGLVRQMVHNRGVDEFRRRLRRDERESKHGQALKQVTPAWMVPGRMREELEYEELCGWAFYELPDGCRQVQLMVREPNATYKTVAKRLGISESAVGHQVTKAQRRLRSELLASGISLPPARKGGASRKRQLAKLPPSLDNNASPPQQ